MSDQTPPPEWRQNVQTAGQGSKVAVYAAIGIAVLALGWTQMQRGAQNEQDLIDQLPSVITRVGAVEQSLDGDRESLTQIRADISELRTGLALVPDQGQVDRRDEEGASARTDLEADVDREFDTLRGVIDELEEDLEQLESSAAKEIAELNRAVGALEGIAGFETTADAGG